MSCTCTLRSTSVARRASSHINCKFNPQQDYFEAVCHEARRRASELSDHQRARNCASAAEVNESLLDSSSQDFQEIAARPRRIVSL
mmetsp:Transcript_39900/g.105868  ORF Transcript_39900/g.105868 Transcript_39900/m.105868 type:complete len:86 (-) Transcript_39900:348-605(-)